MVRLKFSTMEIKPFAPLECTYEPMDDKKLQDRGAYVVD